MLVNAPLMAFLATSDAPRALRFYRDVVGLRFIADEEHALVFDADGTMLRIQKTGSFTPHPFTALGWSVPDIHGAVRSLMQRDVRFLRYGFLAQDDFGIWQAPTGALVAWFADPDGNTLSLTQLV